MTSAVRAVDENTLNWRWRDRHWGTNWNSRQKRRKAFHCERRLRKVPWAKAWAWMSPTNAWSWSKESKEPLAKFVVAQPEEKDEDKTISQTRAQKDTWLGCQMSELRNEPYDKETDTSGFSGLRLHWRRLVHYGADLEIKSGGQEPYLVKAKLHTRSARTTRVQGEDTIFIVSSYDYPLCPRALKPP